MRLTKRNKFVIFGVAAVAVFGLSACSTGSSAADTAPKAAATSEPDSSPTPAMADPAADLVGSGCAAYASMVPSGPGSVSGMSTDPVAVAASNNPLLTTLVAAVSGQLNPAVNLVDTLNGSEFTVFAPVDDAFAKLPASTVDTLKTPAGADTLKTILTYHVIAGQLAPDAIVGTHATVEGGDVTVTGSGDDLMVNDSKVICGGVHTANATVYLIDTVLSPPAKQ
ncbi:MAG: fasciclin domain-containing protein [Terrimesophilobacter sp.]